LPQTSDWAGEGTNTLAYYKNSQITEEKTFITLGPGRTNKNLIQLYNKLACLSFASSLIFKSKAGAYPSGAQYDKRMCSRAFTGKY
jgi:hypothetical protein